MPRTPVVVIVSLFAAVLAASSASARQPATHFKNFYAPAATRVPVDRNDPALTGGGSLGYNQRAEQGF